MKKLDLMKLFVVMEDLLKLDRLHTTCAYRLMKNKKMIDDDVQIIKDLGKPSQSVLDYDLKRSELCKEFADKDDKKQPVIIEDKIRKTQAFQIILRKEEFDNELRILADEYKDVLEGHKNKIQDVNNIMQEDADEYTFQKIKLEWLPEQISGSIISVLDYIIES